MKDKMIVAIVGILSISAIVCTCVLSGIDGTLVAGGVGVIGTITGYVFGKVK